MNLIKMINLKRMMTLKSFIPKNNFFNAYKTNNYTQKIADKLNY